MLEWYEYPDECPRCGASLPPKEVFPPKSQTKAKVLYVLAAPLMAAWAIGYFLSARVHFLAGGIGGLLVTLLVYFGPGVLLVLAGMCFTRVRHAACSECGHSLDVRAPNVFGIG